MNPLTLAAIGWRAGETVLLADGGEHLVGELSERRRYWLGIDTCLGAPLLRLPARPVPIARWIQGAVQPLPPPPLDPQDIKAWRCHPAIVAVSARSDDSLAVLRGARWSTRALPPGMQIQDVDFDPQGGLWCAGAVPSARIPRSDTEAALRYQADPAGPWVSRSPVLGALSSMRTIGAGGLEALRRVDAAGIPVLATSLCAWFLDDDSSFLFSKATSDTRRDTVLRLANDMVRIFDRSGTTARVLTVGGRLWTRRGRGFKARDLKPAIRRCLGTERQHLTVRGADVRGEELALAVEIAPPGRDSAAGEAEASALLLSGDGGEHFALIRRDRWGDGVDWADVALRR